MANAHSFISQLPNQYLTGVSWQIPSTHLNIFSGMVTTNKTTSSITIIIQSKTEMVITTDASIEMGKNLLHTVCFTHCKNTLQTTFSVFGRCVFAHNKHCPLKLTRQTKYLITTTTTIERKILTRAKIIMTTKTMSEHLKNHMMHKIFSSCLLKNGLGKLSSKFRVVKYNLPQWATSKIFLNTSMGCTCTARASQ